MVETIYRYFLAFPEKSSPQAKQISIRQSMNKNHKTQVAIYARKYPHAGIFYPDKFPAKTPQIGTK